MKLDLDHIVSSAIGWIIGTIIIRLYERIVRRLKKNSGPKQQQEI